MCNVSGTKKLHMSALSEFVVGDKMKIWAKILFLLFKFVRFHYVIVALEIKIDYKSRKQHFVACFFVM
jgi:hypothetical protein